MTEITREEFDKLNHKAFLEMEEKQNKKREEICQKYDKLIVDEKEKIKIIKDPYEKETAKRQMKAKIEELHNMRSKEIKAETSKIKEIKCTKQVDNESEIENIAYFILVIGIIGGIICISCELYGIFLTGTIVFAIMWYSLAPFIKHKYYKI